ncbi:AMP-binding-domain-containing protein [Coniochaeta ligniaria NRRL 30616]|uniref:AMP-binding-domain-containing protein n=1 Tax=Coniochaeta ligniaria NRRL 30616 TaxID=1408157 RepID=A0A1J7I9T7_9PEZI|nr:AMP-binding-domain-containing protein [Coniochaeta ligniaria NRRL 30616]
MPNTVASLISDPAELTTSFIQVLLSDMQASDDAAWHSDTAFILHTSGSTGAPKGVPLSHAAFCSSVIGHSSTLRLSTGTVSRILQSTVYTSDVSIGEMFTSLAMGSYVCVPSDNDRMNNLAGSIADQGVNWAFLTPIVAALLTLQEAPRLRTLLFAVSTLSQYELLSSQLYTATRNLT